MPWVRQPMRQILLLSPETPFFLHNSPNIYTYHEPRITTVFDGSNSHLEVLE